MKIKYLSLNAGTILVWKDYNFFKKLWYKIINKNLEYNRILLLRENTEYCYIQTLNDIKIYTPIKEYNNRETNKLKLLTSTVSSDWKEIMYIINIIRPKTFNNIPSEIDNNYLANNNYYRMIDADKESKEYIY